MGLLVIIYGLPGVGKTTLANEIESDYGLSKQTSLSTDQMRAELDEMNEFSKKYVKTPKNRQKIRDKLRQRIEDLLGSGESFVMMQSTFSNNPPESTGQDELEKYLEFVNSESHEYLAIEVVCKDEEKIIQRINNRPARDNGCGTPNSYLRHKKLYNLTPPKNYVKLDTSGTLNKAKENLKRQVYPKIDELLESNRLKDLEYATSFSKKSSMPYAAQDL